MVIAEEWRLICCLDWVAIATSRLSEKIIHAVGVVV
jgi:hypothetical protein